MKLKSVFALLLTGAIVLSGIGTVFGSTPSNAPEQGNKEVLAGLEIIRDPDIIKEIIEKNPRIAKYMDKNEILADLEIITDSKEIAKILEENPHIKALMSQKTDYYYIARIKGEGVRLRKSPSTSATTNGLLYEKNKDWVLLNDNYDLADGYLWWEVVDSSIGFPGWVANDFVYLNLVLDRETKKFEETKPNIDYSTLKIIP